MAKKKIDIAPKAADSEPTSTGSTASQPQVLVLGDYTVDLFIYDPNPVGVPPSPPSLSRESWQYAPGYEARYCLGGAAAIHAMLREHGFPVQGNSFQSHPGTSAETEPTGSIFVLRKRANTNAKGAAEQRRYLSITNPSSSAEPPKEPELSAVKLKEPTPATDSETDETETPAPEVVSRPYTWRVNHGFLNLPDKQYTNFSLADYNLDEATIVCLFDIRRGFSDLFSRSTSDGPKTSRPIANNKTMVIRTADPKRFESLLSTLREGSKVLLVCPIDELSDDNMRTSGTWSDIWRHTYDYLRHIEYLINPKTSDWRFDIIVPVYEDGALWFGPNQWPVDQNDHVICRQHQAGAPSTGRLFVLPGAQPRLYEFEEPDLTIGTTLLVTYTIIRMITGLLNPSSAQSVDEAIAVGIKLGLTRMRRFHSRGYCELSELTRYAEGGPSNVFISQPREVWKDEFARYTDLLVQRDRPIKSDRFADDQLGGAYEVRSKIDKREFGKPGADVFRAMEKSIGGDFVASAAGCRRVATLFEKADGRKRRWDIKEPAEGTADGADKVFIDSFLESEIADFLLERQISMQFGKFSVASPFDTKAILDLAHRVKQHVSQYRYLGSDRGEVFSFALFGTPGSGKSLLAKEMARSIDPGGDIFELHEFNLSQFGSKEQLRQAFARVAASGLGAKVPLVLWDEFDSVLEERRGGWLGQFLMPMQDAKYFDGEDDRFLGTGVFVFIGGTFATAAEFREWASDDQERNGVPPDSVLLKGRDFHSRLFAALDMPAITYYEEEDSSAKNNKSAILSRRRQLIPDFDEVSNYTRLARAALVRTFLLEHSEVNGKPVIEHVEQPMLDFLLNVPLRHGARSLKRIVEACLVRRPKVLGKRHLPPSAFLAEHIETKNFVWSGGKSGDGLEGVLSAFFDVGGAG